jgi:hypothetical protein
MYTTTIAVVTCAVLSQFAAFLRWRRLGTLDKVRTAIRVAGIDVVVLM